MKLNLQLFQERTAHLGTKIIVGSESSKALSPSVKFAHFDREMDDHHVYVCSAENYHLVKGTKAQYVAIAGEVPEQEILDSGQTVLLFPAECSKATVLHTLQDLVDMYESWYNDVLDAIQRGDSLQQISDTTAEALGFPFALFDKSSLLILKAGETPEDTQDSVWQDVLMDGYFPSDEIPPQHSRRVYEQMMENEWPVLYHSRKHDECHLTCALFVRGNFYGVVGAASTSSFTEGQMALYWTVKQLLELALLHNSQKLDTSQEVPYFIARMLSGYSIDEATVVFQLRQHKWQRTEEFCVYRIESVEGPDLYEEDSQRYLASLSQVLPDSFLFFYEGGIVSITRTYDAQRDSKDLRALIAKLDLRIGMSLPYRDFMQVKYAYLQCKHTLGCNRERVSEFCNNYSTCVVQVLEQATSLKSLCHPRILSYWQQGGSREHEYVRCLQAYLLNGRNLTDATKKLKLHRNTLVYRIKKMSDVLNIDLNANVIDDETVALLLTSCLLVQHVFADDEMMPFMPTSKHKLA